MVQTRKYVLVVDDDPEVRDVVVLALSLASFIVQVAESREQALEYIEQSEPAVILLDWFMPGMAVEEFVEKIHREYPSVEIVLTSAAQQAKQKAKRLGIRQVLCKPFEPTELVAIVSLLTGSRKS